MLRIARTPIAPFLLSALLSTACSQMPAPFWSKDRTAHSDTEASFDPPETYPEWAYDQPEYVKPTHELTAEPKVSPGDPLHYFTRDNLVMIRRPEGYTPEEIPRVGIWWTDNNGFHWNKAGYFGREQTFFPFEADEDGDYGIRFVGPGQEPAMHSLPYPDRVYHVDTQLPTVEVAVEPDQAWFEPGQEVTVSWTAEDYHLIEYPVCVTLLFDFSTDGAREIELQRDSPDRGSFTYALPPESADQELRFRVDALDRAGNLGVAFTHALQVAGPDAEQGLAPIASHDDAAAEPSLAMTMPPDETDDDAIDAGEDVVIDEAPDEHSALVPAATAAARAIADIDLASLWDLPESALPPDEPAVAANDESFDETDPSTPPIDTPPIELAAVDRTPQPTDGAVFAGDADDDPVEESLDAVIVENALATTAFQGDLAAPFPATVDPADLELLISAHPWRVLTERIGSLPEAIWQLPRPLFDRELDWLFEADQLANGSVAWPVTEPAQPRAIAGEPSPDETLGGHFNNSP